MPLLGTALLPEAAAVALAELFHVHENVDDAFLYEPETLPVAAPTLVPVAEILSWSD